MKRKTILSMLCILSFLAPSFLSAKESVDRDSTKFQNWKFAAGITLYSDMNMNAFLKKQPLEFNFRYTPDNRHTFRLNIPLILKYDLPGDSKGEYFTENITVQELADKILQREYGDYDFVQKKTNSSVGISLGYDYSYPLISRLSLFAGVDVGYLNKKDHISYYNANYSLVPDNPEKPFILSFVLHIDSKMTGHRFFVEPLVGLRYPFRQLLFEASLGYNMYRDRFYMNRHLIEYYIESEIIRNTPKKFFGKRTWEEFTYSFVLFYTF